MTDAKKSPAMSIWEMLRARHTGDAWIFVEEVGNGTGSNVNRHADALAMGLWPSRGYEVHGYEIKHSRGDVRRELDDPSKADAVGKFCDFWWLVVADLSIIDGLVVPSTWGVLYPRSRVLRVHRKAPKREPTAVNRAFAAALIRKALKSWVPKHEYDALKATALEQAKKEIERDRGFHKDEAVSERDELRAAVALFEKHTGVEITQEYGYKPGERHPLNQWQLDRIGRAVKVVMDARDIVGSHRSADADNSVGLVEQELNRVKHGLGTLEQLAGNRRSVVSQLEEMLARLRADVGSTE